MAEVDRLAPEPVDELIGRAASAVARVAMEMLGGTYGRRVVVVAGPGNNGNDGRVAAQLLTRRGIRCAVLDAAEVSGGVVPPCDLVIDAAYGTGFRGDYVFPDVGAAPVLAVDVPSGVFGLTGQVGGSPAAADVTVTFAAIKPGLLFGEGAGLAGTVLIADIGLDVSVASAHLVDDADVSNWVPPRRATAHKWQHAVSVVAGSPGMTGAAALVCGAALRAGSGYVRLSVPGATATSSGVPVEAVEILATTSPSEDVPTVDDAIRAALVGIDRCAAVVVGPGLGRSSQSRAVVRSIVESVAVPLVVDGDGLRLLGPNPASLLAHRRGPTILTPHDGEFAELSGEEPPADRIAAVRQLSSQTNCVVLLKGPTTVVANPDGEVLLVRSGDERLATAGTGDVLSGIIAAHLALGAEPLRAAAAAAHLHGCAAMLGPARGLIASDLVGLLPAAWDTLATLNPA